MNRTRAVLIWLALATALIAPVAIAATSPLLAWRDPVYIAAGFAGVVAMAFLLLQPLLAAGALPGLPGRRGRRLHLAFGVGLAALVLAHVVGLWATSPPDVIDALLFRSPTPFSAWGVIAMWAVFAAALLAAFRRRLRPRPRLWRLGHMALVSVTVASSVVHALLIEGTMGTASKAVLCVLVLAAATWVLASQRPWTLLRRRKA